MKSMSEKEKFPNAFQFFASYFHQDFGDEFGDPELATQSFIAGSDAEGRRAVIREITMILSELNEGALERIVFELGCYYDPQRHRGLAMSEWLRAVVDQLGKAE